MAGNFWRSSHYQQWLLDRQENLYERSADLKFLSEEEYQKLFIFFCNLIQTLGEQLKVKQQVIATAIVYFRRFYVRNSLKSIDPLLLAPTSIYLASKVEEFGAISQSKLVATCQTLIKSRYSYVYPQDFPYRLNHIHEAEFFLLEMMDCCLIVYHPYRPLVQLMQDISQDEAVISTAWKVLNDSYRSDVCLLFPPYQIALACLHIAFVLLGKDMNNWFAEISVDTDRIFEIEKQIFAMYSLWKTFDEKKEIVPLLQKVPKPKTQPSRPPSAADNATTLDNANTAALTGS
ncbi:Cyclin-C [Trichinella nativa]|uniref:Cyclin domain protein n=4 Tax=Trichinella TaxID=6333 RepID=A0A0V1LSC9_9BILA|nr:cyclin-C [Trichinella spiralis]KRX46470.1 Cyclin-C [Trichinella murrelli]KRX58751.1 Cyclin-C [Trichinella sp. T9]KRX80999.1 Cyclin-C [Trichinella sp. T6]KRZ62406.1 Cyclin-C [Trichinella nativa]KRZ87196.1 Cyclin-C [Trichinella sp. T8]